MSLALYISSRTFKITKIKINEVLILTETNYMSEYHSEGAETFIY